MKPSHNLKNIFFLSTGVVCLFLFTSCDRATQKRTYEEIFLDSSHSRDHDFMKRTENDDPHAGLTDMDMQTMMRTSTEKRPLSWTLPEAWEERPGTGMRLVTFKSSDSEDLIDCSVISLYGSAGGLTSNVTRWMRQINIAIPTEAELAEFIEQQEQLKTVGGLSAILIDLTSLQKKSDLSAPSMMAAILTLEDSRIFVKMTGTRQAVLNNAGAFKSLVQSLKVEK